MPTNTNTTPSDTNTNITTAPFPFPAETKPEATVEIDNLPTTQNTSSFIQEKKDEISSIFPKTLESSGYIILSGVALIFSLVLLICAIRFKKLITIAQEKNNILQKSLQEKNEIFQDITISLYAQQQVIEYRKFYY